MIIWIQRTFARHTKAVMLFLLVVVTIPFVFTGVAGSGQSGQKIKEREFFGYNLASGADIRRIGSDAQLSMMFGFSGRNMNQGEVETLALQRVAGLHLARQYNIPEPTEVQLSAYISRMPAFHDENGQFSAQLYTRFQDALKTQKDFSVAQVRRVMAEDWSLEQLNQLLSGPGYLQSEDAKNFLKLLNAEWTIQIAEIDFASYAPAVSVTEDALTKFFEENAFRYEVTPRASVDYVVFDTASFPQVEPTDAEVLAFYEANKERFPKPSEDAPKPPMAVTNDSDFWAVRTKVRETMSRENALRAATSAASDFTVELFNRKLSKNSPEIAALIAQHKGVLKSAKPFTDRISPEGLNWPRGAVAAAHALSDDRFFSEPLNIRGVPTVILWKETLAGYKPTLADVRAEVASDYTKQEKRKAFTAAGALWKASLTQALASGKSFAGVAEKLAGASNVSVKSPAAFSMRNPPEDVEAPVLSTLRSAKVGSVSEFVMSADKGFLVHFVSAKEPRYDEQSEDFKRAAETLRSHSRVSSQMATLGQIVTAELKKTAPASEK